MWCDGSDMGSSTGAAMSERWKCGEDNGEKKARRFVCKTPQRAISFFGNYSCNYWNGFKPRKRSQSYM